jgi:PAC2 family
VTELHWLASQPGAPRGESADRDRPILLVALQGWFDAAGAATNALRVLKDHSPIETLATIDPDGFYDFTQQRPLISLDEAEQPQVTWPANEVVALRTLGQHRDLITLTGVEPHIRWRTFVDMVIEVAQALDCIGVVTVGATADAVPHTRTPQAIASTTNAALADRLGLAAPHYQGITGVVGVLQTALEDHELFGISLRVPVPYYLGNAQHPRSTAALLRYLEHIVGLPTHAGSLDAYIELWQHRHDAAVFHDPQARSFVAALEDEFDRHAQQVAMPSGDDLAEQFERFLREQSDGRDDNPPDGQ